MHQMRLKATSRQQVSHASCDEPKRIHLLLVQIANWPDCKLTGSHPLYTYPAAKRALSNGLVPWLKRYSFNKGIIERSSGSLLWSECHWFITSSLLSMIELQSSLALSDRNASTLLSALCTEVCNFAGTYWALLGSPISLTYRYGWTKPYSQQEVCRMLWTLQKYFAPRWKGELARQTLQTCRG